MNIHTHIILTTILWLTSVSIFTVL